MTKKYAYRSKTWLSSAFCVGAALSTVSAAFAMNGTSSIKFDGGPLGSLVLSGGATGYAYALSGTGDAASSGLLGTDKSTGAEFLNGLIQIQKPSGPVQFTIEVGSTTSMTLGVKPTPSSVQDFPTGPLFAGYITLAPTSNFTISAGQLPSLEGWESAIDWNNANVMNTDIFYVENSQSRGVAATYSHGPLSASVTFGDGFDTGVWNFLQGLVTYSPDSDNSISLFGASNLGKTGLNAGTYGQTSVGTYGANYINSTMVGGYYSFTKGNLNLVPEVQYVYAKPSTTLGLTKFSSNFGAALFVDYSFGKTPYSLGAWVEYFNSTGPDLWFLNPGAKGVGLSFAPTWQKNYLFLRGDIGLLHLTNLGVPGSVGYGASGTSRNQATALLEAGILF